MAVSRPIEVLPFGTKVVMPRRRPDTLTRLQVVDFLREHIDRHLYLIVAPSGYGKTTFLVDFAHQTELPAAYYRLDSADRDLRTFLTYLIHAVRRIAPAFGEQSLGALARSTDLSQDLPAIVGVLISELDRHVEDMTLIILDDYQAVNDSDEINQAVDLLLTYLPQQIRLMVASRRIPRISLSRFVVQQDVVGVSAKHLRFSAEEIQQFVRTSYGLALTGPAAERLTATMNGWIAGVVLSLHSRASIASINLSSVEAPLNAEEQVFEYLASHVLADEERDVREFLLGSAVLESMTAEDCDRLLGRQGSSPLLAQLDQAGLFIERFDGRPPSYMYQSLFRRFLLDQLGRESPARLRALHRAAGDLRREAGRWAEAADHYLLAEQIDLAADVLEEWGERAFEAGARQVLNDLLARLPETVIVARPALASLWAATLMELGNVERATELFELAHARFVRFERRAEAARVLARLAVLQRFHRAPHQALETARRALAEAPPDDRALLAEVRTQIGIGLGMLGQLDESIKELAAASELAEAAGDRYRVAIVHRALSVDHLRAGRLDAAEFHLQASINRWRELENVAHLAEARANLVDLQYRRGQYAEGERLAREVVAAASELGLLRVEAQAWLGLGDILLDTGRIAEAVEAFDQGLETAQQAQLRYLTIYGLARAGLAEALHGDRRRGEMLARMAVEQARRHGTEYEAAVAESELAAVLLHHGEAEEARNLLTHAISRLDATGSRSEAALARLRLVRAAFETQRFRLATTTMRRVAAAALELGEDAALVAELARGPSFIRYMQKRRAGADWLDTALDRLPEVKTAGVAAPAEAAETAHRIALRAFGELEVTLDGRLLGERDWGGERVRNLFLYLAISERSRERQSILRDLWPELPTTKGNVAFQAALSRLRRALYPECVTFEAGQYALDPEAEWWRDVTEFRRLLDEGEMLDPRNPQRLERLAAAMALYRGPFLPDLEADWANAERNALERRALRALRLLAQGARDTGRYAEAADWYRRLAEYEPYDEEIGYQLMQALLNVGDRVGARREYQRLRTRLRRELHTEPGKRLTKLYDYLKRPRSRPFAE